ncbi:hypothetical protein NC653_011754 [Populus alba x Populus x berolinensis]|nr:hypothetical protein NC653_011754 [Populus alba x Populus x berolinensis]
MKDFLRRCFERDHCERWSADTLLTHSSILDELLPPVETKTGELSSSLLLQVQNSFYPLLVSTALHRQLTIKLPIQPTSVNKIQRSRNSQEPSKKFGLSGQSLFCQRICHIVSFAKNVSKRDCLKALRHA